MQPSPTSQTIATVLLSTTSAALGPLRPGARATVPATRSRFRHQRRSRTRARIAPAAVAFSHQVLLSPAVAIRDLSLRPDRAAPAGPSPSGHVPASSTSRTSGPGAVSAFAFQEAPTPPTGRPLASPRGSWPCQFSRQSAQLPLAGQGGRPLAQFPVSHYRYRASDRGAAESAGSASRLSPAVRRCPGERGRPEHGSLGQSETPRPVTAGSSAQVYSSTPCCQFGSRTVAAPSSSLSYRSRARRQNRMAGRFGARR